MCVLSYLGGRHLEYSNQNRGGLKNTFGETDESFAIGHSKGLQIIVCALNIHMRLASSDLKEINVSVCSCVELVDIVLIWNHLIHI